MKIAVTCEIENPEKESPKYGINKNYLEFVRDAGYLPFVVGNEIPEDVIAREFDGLLLVGGRDISPIMVGRDLEQDGSQRCNIERDMYEKSLYRAFIRRKKPVFGICRGFQMICILNKFKLFQEINRLKGIRINHNQGSVDIGGSTPTHFVQLYGKLREITYGSDAEGILSVNSFHHQGVAIDERTSRRLSQNINCIGWAESRDKECPLLEALIIRVSSSLVVDWENKEDILNDIVVGGVQWHPERLPMNKKHIKIFQAVMTQSFVEREKNVAGPETMQSSEVL